MIPGGGEIGEYPIGGVEGYPVGISVGGGSVGGGSVGGGSVGEGSVEEGSVGGVVAVVGTTVGGTVVVETFGGLVALTGGGLVGTIGVREPVVGVPIGVGPVGVGETGVGEMEAPGSKTKKGGKEISPLGVRYVPAHAIGVRIWGRMG